MPKISKVQYREYLSTWLLENYFDGANQEIINFFNQSKSLEELL